jgi:hypothetical protein
VFDAVSRPSYRTRKVTVMAFRSEADMAETKRRGRIFEERMAGANSGHSFS